MSLASMQVRPLELTTQQLKALKAPEPSGAETDCARHGRIRRLFQWASLGDIEDKFNNLAAFLLVFNDSALLVVSPTQ